MTEKSHMHVRLVFQERSETLRLRFGFFRMKCSWGSAEVDLSAFGCLFGVGCSGKERAERVFERNPRANCEKEGKIAGTQSKKCRRLENFFFKKTTCNCRINLFYGRVKKTRN